MKKMSSMQTVFSDAKSALYRLLKGLRRLKRHRDQVKRAKRVFGVKSPVRDHANKAYREEIKAYWKEHFGKPVHPAWHIACANVTGIKDVRYIPTNHWFDEILPFFNNMDMRPAYRDKNLSDVLLRYTRIPGTVIKRMHGWYYGHDNKPITPFEANQRIQDGPHGCIIKPSQTDDGYGINSLTVEGGQMFLNGHPVALNDLEKQYGRNFIVQERIIQHPLMAEVHPVSVNTIRMVTFRWRNEIRLLLAFARFGTGGRLTDNAGTGGLCCGIDGRGRLNDTAVDMAGKIYERHPTTGYSFLNRVSIPDYDNFCSLALDLHRQIFHFDIVSWDFAVGYQGEPIFLEVNFRGVVHVYQFACRQPLFGDLTKDILEMIRDNRRTEAVKNG